MADAAKEQAEEYQSILKKSDEDFATKVTPPESPSLFKSPRLWLQSVFNQRLAPLDVQLEQQASASTTSRSGKVNKQPRHEDNVLKDYTMAEDNDHTEKSISKKSATDQHGYFGTSVDQSPKDKNHTNKEEDQKNEKEKQSGTGWRQKIPIFNKNKSNDYKKVPISGNSSDDMKQGGNLSDDEKHFTTNEKISGKSEENEKPTKLLFTDESGAAPSLTRVVFAKYRPKKGSYESIK